MTTSTRSGGDGDRPVRIAIMSDIHRESDLTMRARCGTCDGLMFVASAGQTAFCTCGESMIDAGDGHYSRAMGNVKFLPPRDVSWGDTARNGGADLVILAGDIDNGAKGVKWAAEEFWGLPVVFVPGNHEYWGDDMSGVLSDMVFAAAQTPNVRVLDRERAVYRIRGRRVRVLGATLWTDYAILAAHGFSQADAMRVAARGINDHRRIKLKGGLFLPTDALALHRKAKAWLSKTLAKPYDGQTILVTHHAPVPEGLHPDYVGDAFNGAFASDLSGLLWRYPPDLVVWGHTHASVDIRRGSTRLVSHQRGYADRGDPDFQPVLIDLDD